MSTPGDSTIDTNRRRMGRQQRGLDETQHYPGSPSPEVLRQLADDRNLAVPDTAYTRPMSMTRPGYPAEGSEPKSQSARTPRLVNDSDMHPAGSPESGRSLPLTASASDRARVLAELGQPAPPIRRQHQRVRYESRPCGAMTRTGIRSSPGEHAPHSTR